MRPSISSFWSEVILLFSTSRPKIFSIEAYCGLWHQGNCRNTRRHTHSVRQSVQSQCPWHLHLIQLLSFYSPLKSGARFSKNACTPSLKSYVFPAFVCNASSRSNWVLRSFVAAAFNARLVNAKPLVGI